MPSVHLIQWRLRLFKSHFCFRRSQSFPTRMKLEGSSLSVPYAIVRDASKNRITELPFSFLFSFASEQLILELNNVMQLVRSVINFVTRGLMRGFVSKLLPSFGTFQIHEFHSIVSVKKWSYVF